MPDQTRILTDDFPGGEDVGAVSDVSRRVLGHRLCEDGAGEEELFVEGVPRSLGRRSDNRGSCSLLPLVRWPILTHLLYVRSRVCPLNHEFTAHISIDGDTVRYSPSV